MKKGGKRKGSGRKSIKGKEVKIKIPLEVIEQISKEYKGNTLSDKIRKSIDNGLYNKSNFRKYRVIDLFSGCGGIAEGFRQNDRMEIVGAIDFNRIACETFKYNFPQANVICGDITKINVKDTDFKNIDIIVGGPPCQGFSALNRHQKLEDDPRNKLFLQFLRFVRELNPKAIMIENVRQILTSKDGFVRRTICDLMEEMGYNVEYKILDSSDYGVPQKRMRAVFVGVRNDVGKINFNDINKYKVDKKITVNEALCDLYEIEKNVSKNKEDEVYVISGKISNEYLKKIHDGTNHIFNHRINYPNDDVQKRISFVPQGGNWKNIPEEYFPSQRNNRHSNYMKRLDGNDLSITIDTGHAVYFHPIYNRVPSARESARIQSFPDRFVFLGNKGEQLKQVGNAVPPLMAFAVSKMILEVLDSEK